MVPEKGVVKSRDPFEILGVPSISQVWLKLQLSNLVHRWAILKSQGIAAVSICMFAANQYCVNKMLWTSFWKKLNDQSPVTLTL